jgi:hypothetical protein
MTDSRSLIKILSRLFTVLTSLGAPIFDAVILILAIIKLHPYQSQLPAAKVLFIIGTIAAILLIIIAIFMIVAIFLKKFCSKVLIIISLILFAFLGIAFMCFGLIFKSTVKSAFLEFETGDDYEQMVYRIFVLETKSVDCSAKFDEIWKTWGIVLGVVGILDFLLGVAAVICTVKDLINDGTIETQVGNESDEEAEKPRSKPVGRAARVSAMSSSDDESDDWNSRDRKRGHRHGNDGPLKKAHKKKSKKGHKRKARSESDEGSSDDREVVVLR